MNWLEQWNRTTTKLRARWGALAAPQRRMVVLGALAFVALTAASVWWSTRTDWRVLFRYLDGRDAAQVQQELAAAGIPFQSSADGVAIEVAAENLDKARIAIAAKGMPQSGRLGFELFDKPNWAGSEFDEKVNYQRALEGELEHTIANMDAVRSARVHLVLPVHGAFSNEDQPAKASVVLTLRRTVDPRTEGAAMRALVSGAVEGLSPGAVALIDADGRIDFSGNNGQSQAHEEETALQQKMIAVLEPLTGVGNVRATVNVSYVTGSEERNDEVYDPNSAVPVSTQKTEQTSQMNRVGGVAGTASNTPALVPSATANPKGTGESGASANGTAAPGTPGTAAANPTPGASGGSGPMQLSREENSSYAVTRHTVHTEEGPGRVRRIAAAVVINDRAMTNTASKGPHTIWKARTADEMKRLQQIAQAAVGFDAQRGDEVIVQNVAFSRNTEEAATSGFAGFMDQGKDLLRSQPSLLRTLVVGASLLLLGMLVLRPLGRQTVAALALPDGKARIHDAQLLLQDDSGISEGGSAMQKAAQDPQRLLQQVAARIQAEPQGSARLVESWITAGSEREQ